MTFFCDFEWPDNKYSKRYISLIKKALDGKWAEYSGYTERHHIIPKSFGGGNNKTNIIALPGKYHYHAHYWLMKMFPAQSKPGRAMIAGFRKMNLARDYQARPVNSRLYEELRLRAKIAGTGRKMTEDNKAKLIASRRGVITSEETKRKISEAHTGRKLSEEHKKKINPLGRQHSSETKQKIGSAHIGMIRSEQARANMREGRKKARELKHQTMVSAEMTPTEPKTDI